MTNLLPMSFRHLGGKTTKVNEETKRNVEDERKDLRIIHPQKKPFLPDQVLMVFR